MSQHTPYHSITSKERRAFPTTCWTLILASANEEDSKVALEEICSNYWQPLYGYTRRQGQPHEDARDAVQQFFLSLIEKKQFAQADKARGCFRNYLLTMFQNFLNNQKRWEQADKRGGKFTLLPRDAKNWSEQHEAEISPHLSPEELFNHRWAKAVLQQAQQLLQEEYRQAGKDKYYEKLHPFLGSARRGVKYTEIGEALGISTGSVGVAVHRIRRRFGELIRQEVSRTVERAEEVDDEIRFLLSILRA